MLARNLLVLGAPILDSTIATEKIIADGMVVLAGYTPIMITPTYTNGGKQRSSSDGGSSSGGSSGSSSSDSSSSTVTYDVKTGTTKKWQDHIPTTSYDPFKEIKVLDEETKKQSIAIINREVKE